MIFFLWLFGFFILCWDNSPIIILLRLIFLGIVTTVHFLHSDYGLLFFLWLLVYVGGIIIVFTYVIFFSQIEKTPRKSSFPQKIFFAQLFTSFFIGGWGEIKTGGLWKMQTLGWTFTGRKSVGSFLQWRESYSLINGAFITLILVSIILVLFLVLFLIWKKNIKEYKMLLL